MSVRIKGWLCAMAVSMMTAGAYADELLIVDLSVVDEITITATSGNSDITTSGGDGIGVYLQDFYSGPGTTGLNETLVSGDLTNAENPADNSPNLFRAGTADPGLNIFSWSPDTTVTFTAGSLAFTGSGTWSLNSDDYADMLPAIGSTGNLYFPADDVSDIPNARILGTYRVVPEPGTLSLLGLCLIAGLRRR